MNAANLNPPTSSRCLRQSMEVVDPDPNAADRLHVVSLAAAAQFCNNRSPPLRPDYFRKMLRGEQDEHRGWMLRAASPSIARPQI